MLINKQDFHFASSSYWEYKKTCFIFSNSINHRHVTPVPFYYYKNASFQSTEIINQAKYVSIWRTIKILYFLLQFGFCLDSGSYTAITLCFIIFLSSILFQANIWSLWLRDQAISIFLIILLGIIDLVRTSFKAL